jgi:hypothetical protein
MSRTSRCDLGVGVALTANQPRNQPGLPSFKLHNTRFAGARGVAGHVRLLNADPQNDQRFTNVASQLTRRDASVSTAIAFGETSLSPKRRLEVRGYPSGHWTDGDGG